MFQSTLLRIAFEKVGKVLNRIYVVELLKREGKFYSAVGFHYQNGDFLNTVIACGGANIKLIVVKEF